jgi:hypothetical protein
MSELLLWVERHQAVLTWEAMSQGLPVTHRPDCDPKAVLGVVAIVRAMAQPSQPSPHAFEVGLGGH